MICTAAIEQWQSWGLSFTKTPEILGPLPGGLTNTSYLLQGADSRWVLRINADNSAQLGIDRDLESRILAITAEAGLSPKDYFCNLNDDYLVTRYLPGWQQPINNATLAAIAQFMRQLHQLPADQIVAVDYLEYTESYVALLKQSGAWPDDLENERQQTLAHIRKFNLSPLARACLCHHDPSPSHWRLQDGQPCLIDWEYAARRDPACDLALLVQSWRLSPAQVELLLHYYNDGINSGIDQSRLAAADKICRYIERLWFAIKGLYTNPMANP